MLSSLAHFSINLSNSLVLVALRRITLSQSRYTTVGYSLQIIINYEKLNI